MNSRHVVAGANIFAVIVRRTAMTMANKREAKFNTLERTGRSSEYICMQKSEHQAADIHSYAKNKDFTEAHTTHTQCARQLVEKLAHIFSETFFVCSSTPLAWLAIQRDERDTHRARITHGTLTVRDAFVVGRRVSAVYFHVCR